jgi:hypothetical protein
MIKNVYWSSCEVPVEFSRQIFAKYSNVRGHENPCSGSRVAPRGHADGWMDGQTDMTKLIVVFRSFANAPNKIINESSNYIQ